MSPTLHQYLRRFQREMVLETAQGTRFHERRVDWTVYLRAMQDLRRDLA